MSPNVRVTYEKTAIYEKLVDEHGVFNSYTDFFVFAAALGYNKQRRKSDAGGDSEMLWMNVSNTDLYRSVAQAIAYQETGDTDVLSDLKRQLEILQKYAAGGAEIMAERFGDDDPTEDVVRFLVEEGAPVDGDPDSGLADVL